MDRGQSFNHEIDHLLDTWLYLVLKIHTVM